MLRSLLSLCCWLSAFAATWGCAPLGKHTAARSPLTAPRMSPDSVVLEVFWVRLPSTNDPDADASLWSEIDELALSSDTRRLLGENGFRAGIVGAQVPLPLQRLLEMTSQPVAANAETRFEPDRDSKVTSRRMHVRTGKRSEIVASGLHDQFTMLLRQDGQLRGRTFTKGQGLFALRAFPRGDGCLRLELTPELHYGEPRQKWRGNDEMLLLETSRQREILETLSLEAVLSPGQMLLLTSQPRKSGSLGQQFFAQPDQQVPEQRLLLVRLAQTQRDDLFDDIDADDTGG